MGVSLWRETCWLVHCGELETAYERVLIDGDERDLARLMSRTGVCLPQLSGETKALLFPLLSRMLMHHSLAELALPWVLRATTTGEALELPRPVRRDLVRGLYHLLTPATTAAPPRREESAAAVKAEGRRPSNHPPAPAQLLAPQPPPPAVTTPSVVQPADPLLPAPAKAVQPAELPQMQAEVPTTNKKLPEQLAMAPQGA